MRTTQEALNLLKSFEGLRLTAYSDPGTGSSPWTIGYGSTRGVHEGLTISAEQATTRLLEEVEATEDIVTALLAGHFSDNQISALTLFCFNVGFGYKGIKDGFQVLKSGEPSTMLKCLLAGRLEDAADEFPKWCGANPATRDGLLKRRLAEMDLFLKPDAELAEMGGEP